MNRSRNLLVLIALLVLAAGPAMAQEGSMAGPEPMRLALDDCVRETFKNNKEIRIASYAANLRDEEILFQKAQFDANLDSNVTYSDFKSPTPATSVSATFPFLQSEITSSEGSFTDWTTAYRDSLHIGSSWSAQLQYQRIVTSAINIGGQTFPPALDERYYTNLTLSWTQPFLRNFGRKINETQIVIATTDRKINMEDFRRKVQEILVEVEDAYWTLVYERQDLEVRQEALELARELLRLNKIRVDVGTLPPIDITQAEAGVASREEAVIVAEANIEDAEDRLRRVMGLDPQGSDWGRSIVPTEDLTILARSIDLNREVEKAIVNRTDLSSARLQLEKADLSLAYQKNQLKYSLDLSASVQLEGLAGDSTARVPSLANPNVLVPVVLREEDAADSLNVLTDGSFPTYSAVLAFGIPIGNRAAKADYSKRRLEREQASITYADLEQMAIVQVGTAVRRVNTDRKRIDAAEKNRFLQEKTVEAEQRKFENGLSTSFEVLQLQRDLAEARSAENAAKRDYRNSLANLELATGLLDQTRRVRVNDYARN
jgi:outer membrane protein TolC